MKYEVIKEHKSNYPNPITLSKGQRIKLGEAYNGPEKWDHWIYCFTLDGKSEGWVPEQLIQRGDENGIVLDNYTAKELNAAIGEMVIGIMELNGWIWSRKISDGEEGWIPKENVRLIHI